MGYRPLESIKTISFATITNVIGSAVISYEFPKKAQIHTAIQDGKYVYSPIHSQSATGATMNDDVKWSL